MEEQTNIDETIVNNEADNEEVNQQIDGEEAEYKTDVKLRKTKKKDNSEQEEFSFKKEFFSWVRIIIIAVVIAFVINNFIIINANVPTGSMENTIMTESRMVGLRTAYWFNEPERGDIVIFKFPDNEEETFVKRVIGLPGEKVVIKDAKIYINDSEEPLKEDYLPEEWVNTNGSDVPLEYQVPEDSYFVLGDNRNYSKDARYWTNTYVHKDKIIAEAKFVYWPWERKCILKSADYGEQN